MLLSHDPSTKDNHVWAESHCRINRSLSDIVGLNIPDRAIEFNIFPTYTCTSFQTWTSCIAFQTSLMERTNTVELFFNIHWVSSNIIMTHLRVTHTTDKLTTLDDTCTNTCTDCVVNQVFDTTTSIVTGNHFTVGRTIYVCREVHWHV